MVQGIFSRRVNRRLAEIEIDGEMFGTYISNGIEMSFLKNGAACFLREAINPNRRTPFDLYSVYDQDTLVCVDAKEPLHVAEKWCAGKLADEFGKQIPLYTDVIGMSLLAMNMKSHNLTIQVMGTSFIKNRIAYLPEIPSTALNERLTWLLWAKKSGQDPRLLFVACRDDAEAFSANREVDPYFADLLLKVKKAGVPVEALACSVDESGMKADRIIPVQYED